MNMEANLGNRLGDLKSRYYDDGIKGQCVWYVRGRAKEKLGVDTGIRGNANQWYGQAKHRGEAVKSDSIACFGGVTYGHVIYVEHVENDIVYYTEANGDGKNTDNFTDKDGRLKKLPLSDFKKKITNYQGCIYLLEYKAGSSSQSGSGTISGGGIAYTTDNLNYRESPNGTVAGTFPKGTAVKIADDSKVTVGGYVWRKIMYNGKYYYAAEKYLRA